MTHHEKKSKHHDKLLVSGLIVAVAAFAFVLWENSQFPREIIPSHSATVIKADMVTKRAQPQMPVTDSVQQ